MEDKLHIAELFLWIKAVSVGCFLCLIASSTSFAQSRDTTTLEYDASGNLIRIDSTQSTAPPSINNLAPATARRGETITVTATGTNLINANVASDDVGLLISNVLSTSNGVTFTVEVLLSVALGPHNFTFSTSLGSATAPLEVQPVQPSLQVGPVPLSVRPSSQVALVIRLTSPDVVNHTFSVNVANDLIFSVSTAQITIPAGALISPTTVIGSGVSVGSTNLSISGNLGSKSLTAFVTGGFQPPGAPGSEQSLTFFSRPLGVLRNVDEPPDLIERGPFTSLLGVVKSSVPDPDREPTYWLRRSLD